MVNRAKLTTRLKSFHGSGNNNKDGDGSNSAPGSRSSSPTPGGRVPVVGPSSTGGLMLKTHVIKGRNLAPKDKGGSSDPYLVLYLGDSRQSTVSIPKSLNPEWNETIELPIVGLHTMLLEIVCWDKDRFGKDYMGEFEIALEDVFSTGTVAHEAKWYPLESRKRGKKKSFVTGEVLLEFSIYDPVNTAATPQQVLQKLIGMAAADYDFGEYDDGNLSQPGSGGEQEFDGRGESDTSPPEQSDVPEDPSQTETPEKRRRRLKLARLKRKAKQRAYEFSGFSDLAGVLFLEISRISDLPPERNMTRTSFDMDPFVVTSLGKKTYKTKVVRHNLNPVYDEKLVFQVMRHEVNYAVNFTVVDRDKLSGNDFVGTANLPLDNITSLSPDPDPESGLYPLRDPVPFSVPMSEAKKSRFRIPLSRSTSSSSLHRANSKPLMTSNPSSKDLQHLEAPSTHSTNVTSDPMSQMTPSTSITDSPVPTIVQDDPDLKSFDLALHLKNKDRWEDKHKPVIHIRAKYLPYRALRQQFWRAMLRQYDVDESGFMSKVELTTMLDSLGSTLHESTIDKFFPVGEAEEGGEPAISIDHAVIRLEDLLQEFEEKKRAWLHKRLALKAKSARSPIVERTAFLDPEPPMSRQTTHDSTLSSESQSPIDTSITQELNGPPGEEGETLNENDLADEREEERVVEIRECPICHMPRLTKKSDSDIITHVATCASQDWRQVNNIVMAGFVTSSQAQRKWYSKVVTKIGYGGYKLGANSANILVQDRITGLISEERMSVYVRLGIRLLYKGLKSRDMEKKRIRKLLRSMSFKQGKKFDDPVSAAQIQSFVNFHQLDMSEVLLSTDQFKTFNEFFFRKLKPEARPCSAPDRPEIITSPADCRTVVFNEIEEAQKIWVKGREFSIERLFGDAYPDDAKKFKNGGALGIFRLAPQDYHRFHIPVDGIMGEPRLIEGEYYTVNPMAIRSALDVYGENIRVLVPIESDQFGLVMVVCVGAMMVGSTVITRNAGDRVRRSEELGYFKFGGSTILLLFEPGVMVFDSDLVDNANGALETLIRVGMSIGHSPDHNPHQPEKRKGVDELTEWEKADARRRIEGSLAPEPVGLFHGPPESTK